MRSTYWLKLPENGWDEYCGAPPVGRLPGARTQGACRSRQRLGGLDTVHVPGRARLTAVVIPRDGGVAADVNRVAGGGGVRLIATRLPAVVIATPRGRRRAD